MATSEVLGMLQGMRLSMLRQTGRATATVSIGEEALRKLAEETYALVRFRADTSEQEHIAKTVDSARKGELRVFGMQIEVAEAR